MGFEGEFASYEPLRRILDSEKIKALQERIHIQPTLHITESIKQLLIRKNELPQSIIKPDLILAIDGSHLEGQPEKGFPGAEYDYVTIASVLVDLEKSLILKRMNLLIQNNFAKQKKRQRRKVFFRGVTLLLILKKTQQVRFAEYYLKT